MKQTECYYNKKHIKGKQIIDYFVFKYIPINGWHLSFIRDDLFMCI